MKRSVKVAIQHGCSMLVRLPASTFKMTSAGPWHLTFLGTGSANPSPSRGASCMVLKTDGFGGWLFDCGEGSQVQLMKSTIKISSINKIFITHLHGDHVYGLPGLLATMSGGRGEDSPPLELYGPVGLRMLVRTNLNLSRSQLQFKYKVHELQHDVGPADYDGMYGWNPKYEATGDLHYQEIQGRNLSRNVDGNWLVCEDGNIAVRAALLRHRVASFGYVITEDSLPGKLLVDKLKALEVPPVPYYSLLKQGQSIVAPNGVTVLPGDVMGPNRPGRKVVILGDTCDSSSMVPISQGANVLVHEATNENAHEHKCKENGHSTPRMAAKFCHAIGAKQMILTHFSQRYKSDEEGIEPSTEKLRIEALDELKIIQPDLNVAVDCADDLKTFEIKTPR